MDRIAGMQVFVRVAELGSFVRAADALGLSTTVVSRRVQQLETQLGARLLQRTTRRLSLTEAGREYLGRIQSILAALEAAEALTLESRAQATGTLRVSAPVSFGIHHLGPRLASFADAHPAVYPDLALSDRVIDLVDEGIDVAIRIGRRLQPTLVARPLTTTRLMVCASPAYLARHGTPRMPSDLREHRTLAYAYAATGDTWHFRSGSRDVQVRTRPVLRSNNGDLLLVAAEQGLGLVLHPGFLVADALRAGRLVRVLTDHESPALTVSAVYPAREFLPAKTRVFVDFLAAAFAGPAPWHDVERDPPLAARGTGRRSRARV